MTMDTTAAPNGWDAPPAEPPTAPPETTQPTMVIMRGKELVRSGNSKPEVLELQFSANDKLVGAMLAAADAAWLANAALSPFGPRQRWNAMCRDLKFTGWPVLHGPARWRLGELTVPWDAVAPH